MTHTPADADTILLKAPSDIGIRNTDRKATLHGPRKILQDLELEDIHIDQIFPNEFDLQKNQQQIRKQVIELLQHRKPLITLGGDHSISYPAITAVRDRYPDLQLIWIDAHYDLKEPRLEAGIPHDAVVRGLIEDGFPIDDILFIGVREQDPDEESFLQDNTAQTISVQDVQHRTDQLRDLIDGLLDPDRPTYLSFDIDVLDPGHVPGTTFPSSNGLTPDQATQLLDSLDDHTIIAADLVETADPLDQSGKTLQTSRTILQKLLQLVG